MSESRTTTDHAAIKRWAEERGGRPAVVAATHRDEGAARPGEAGGILRIDFEGTGDAPGLETISWDEFFEIFEANKLAFLHQEKTSDGSTSRFFKLVSR
ncbi:hypothetical protein [Marinimicrococcus flavescens]|uniref:1,4-alpha-glucan branching enzyme n=1 Tax=Marinimicrococcus flavescens TaxID=3031815 RepID=A0AAP3UYP4_9PROT|nr:hypothetical protein [Marinimicrococcus flavescens]